MTSKRLFSRLVLGAAGALALAGCAHSGASATAPQPTTALPSPVAPSASPDAARRPARTRLRIGTTGDYAPFSLREGTAEPRGFDVDVARALAATLDADLVWVGTRWPTLEASLQAGEFDVAMSGVTWQAARSVTGYMTRAVARGGPCVLGDPQGAPVAVNRGGVLESWARGRFPESALVTVDDNRTLPDLLASGKAHAIVTDSFELRDFARPGWKVTCEPRLARKVYWVAPGHESLARSLDDFIANHSDVIQAAQERWFGERQPLRAVDHLVDMLARRLAFMPLVAAAKAKAGLPIEDAPREKLVLDAAERRADELGLPAAEVRALFAQQIELAKNVQRRRQEPTTLDLGRQIRPALNELGDRILDAVRAAARAGELESASVSDLELLAPSLEPAERTELLERLHAVGAAAEHRP